MKGIRDLWSEVESDNVEAWRRMIGTGSRILYSLFILVGFFLVLDLYIRPDSMLIKVFGVCAAVLLVASSIFWAWATHHSAAGIQRGVSWVFWGLDIVIYALNLVAEYYHYMNVDMGDLIGRWYYNASMLTVVISVIGWALYSVTSPEQRRADAIARAESKTRQLLERGLEHPSEEAKATMNAKISATADALLTHAAANVAHVKFSPNGNGTTRELNEDVKGGRPND